MLRARFELSFRQEQGDDPVDDRSPPPLAGVGPVHGYWACQYSVTSPTNIPLVLRQSSTGQRHAEVAEDLDLGLVPEDLRVDEQPVHVEDGGGEPRPRRASGRSSGQRSLDGVDDGRVLGLDLRAGNDR